MEKSLKTVKAQKKFNLTIGHYLRDKRIEANLSQRDVSVVCGYNAQFISNWERGISLPPMYTVNKLIKLYNISKADFINLMIEQQKILLEAQLGYKSVRKKA